MIRAAFRHLVRFVRWILPPMTDEELGWSQWIEPTPPDTQDKDGTQ